MWSYFIQQVILFPVSYFIYVTTELIKIQKVVVLVNNHLFVSVIQTISKYLMQATCKDKLETTLYFKCPINMLKIIGPNGEPIATPSAWQYIILLNLNWTSRSHFHPFYKVVSINFTFFRTIYLSILICIVSSKGMLVNNQMTTKCIFSS